MMEVKGAGTGSGVVRHDSDPLRLPLWSSSSELSASWTFLLLSAPLLFAKRDRARATPMVLRQRAHGSKLSRSCRCHVRPELRNSRVMYVTALARRRGDVWGQDGGEDG